MGSRRSSAAAPRARTAVPLIALAGALTSALTGSLAAQGAVRGLVRDKDFDAPLPGARVILLESGQEGVTNAQGTFQISDVPPGTYTVAVTKEGYVRLVRPDVFVADNEVANLSLDLAGDFTELEEFVVRDVLQLGGSSEAALLNLRFESPSLTGFHRRGAAQPGGSQQRCGRVAIGCWCHCA